MPSRYEIYKNFKPLIQKKDTRSMDAICSSGLVDEFRLQAQQVFLRQYMQKYPEWRNLLLYHEIGSGKTCSVITMAEEYLRKGRGTVRVILPARLRTNFLDELISPCGMEAYISKADFELFIDPDTRASVKSRIKSSFMKLIEKNYDIMSFEKFRNTAKGQQHSLKTWATDFTKDAMIVVDEVHNLLTPVYDQKRYDEISKTGVLVGPNGKQSTGLSSILFRYMCEHAHPSCKMVFLTATPIFDNIKQIRDLVRAMSPGTVPVPKTVSDAVEALRGKVSYFPGTSARAYPSVKHVFHEVPLSKTQDRMTEAIQAAGDEDKENDDKEAFLSKQRQVSISCYDSVKKVIGDMSEYGPKIKKLLHVIKKSPGKHVVYSTFVKRGTHMVAAALEKAGWVNVQNLFKMHSKDFDEWPKFKTFALWDSSVNDADKQTIKALVNSKHNIYGERIRVILGSPSVKEGVSFKHVQHIHLMDPVWNPSAKAQVEGRVIRFCSHSEIDPKVHAPLRREVTVDIYKSVPRSGGAVTRTCDEVIYEEIIPMKEKTIRAGEAALKKVAIDHYLFRDMYSENEKKPRKPAAGSNSPLNLVENPDITGKKKTKKNTCPKKRRPVDDECKAGMILKKNAHGDECCYVERGKKKQ